MENNAESREAEDVVRTVYTGLPIHWQSAIRHFPGLGILPVVMPAA